MPYKFLEDVTTADIAFEATGKSLNELFESAADALINSLATPKTVKKHITETFEKKENTIDRLLFEFLEELIYLKDKDAMVFNNVKVVINEKTIELVATVVGDRVDQKTQELHQDVKAVTMHYFKVEKDKNGWRAQVVLDI